MLEIILDLNIVMKYTHLNIRRHGRNLYKHAIYSEKLVNRVVNTYEKYIEKQIKNKRGNSYE